MKMKKILAITMAGMLLMGCSKQEKSKTVALEQGDAQYLTREYLLVERQDFAVGTSEDVKALEQLAGIERVELYGTADRIAYYTEKGSEYVEGEDGSLELTDTGKRVRNAAGLTQEDLTKGTLPEAMNEIAVYATDEDVIGTTVTIYLYDTEYRTQTYDEWEYAGKLNQGITTELGEGVYTVKRDFVITGILSEKTTQVYYSDAFCEMISRAFAGSLYAEVMIQRIQGEEGTGLTDIPGELSLEGNTRIGQNGSYISNLYNDLSWQEDVEYRVYFDDSQMYGLVLYNEDCEKNEVRISDRFVNNNYTEAGKKAQLYKALLLNYYEPEGSIYEDVAWVTDSASMLGTAYRLGSDKRVQDNLVMRISDTTHNSGMYVLEVDKEMFDRIYAPDKSYEMAIFPKEDADVETIKEELQQAGYQVVEHKSWFEIIDRISDKWEFMATSLDGVTEKIDKTNYKEYLEKVGFYDK
jgi:hypothetical protein